MDSSKAAHDELRSTNSLGKAGFTVSVFGCACCVSALVLIAIVGASNTPDQSSYPDHHLVKGVQVINDGLTFLGQVILFVVGGLVGGTLSLVGIGLSVAGLRHEPNRLAKAGIVVSVIGPTLLVIKFIITL